MTIISQLIVYKQLRKVKKFREDRKLRALQKQKKVVQDLKDRIHDLEKQIEDFQVQRIKISDNMFASVMNQLITQREFTKIKSKIYHLHLQQQEMQLQVVELRNQLVAQERVMEEKRDEYLAAHLETNKFDEVVNIQQQEYNLFVQKQEEQELNEFIDEMNVLNIERM